MNVRMNLIWGLSVMGLWALFPGSGCRPTSRASYQFESHPRTVLAAMGVQHSGDPKLAVSSSGTVYMLAVYGQGKSARLGLAMSHNGGDTFMPVVPVSKEGAGVSSHGENSPSLALAPTAIYALWEQMTGHGSTELMVARSVNFGHSFEKPVRVTDKTKPSFNGFSFLGVAPNGDVYAAWLDARDTVDPSQTFALYLARSTDKGATFGSNIRVSLGACPCCRPTIAFGSNREAFIAWRKVFPGNIRDIVVSASGDHGQTFSAPVRVAVDNWRLNGCPHAGPTIIPHDGGVYVAWSTEGAEHKPRISLSSSNDGAKTFAPALDVSGNILDPNHPAFARSEDGNLALVFQGRNVSQGSQGNGWTPIQAFLIPIRGKGEVSQPEPVPGDQQSGSYPALAMGTAGRIFVAWTESAQQGSTIVLCRGRGGSS